MGGDEDAYVPATFNINYFRPHYFGIEAAAEVAAFVQAFDLGVLDPQAEGMDEGPFTVQGFLSGWNGGNRQAYRAMVSSNELSDYPSNSTECLERVWKWNFGRRARQESVGESLYVPKYMFMRVGQHTQTAVIWPDACPILLPPCDHVLLFRDELAIQPTTGDNPEIAVVPWEQLATMLAEFPPVSAGVPYYRLDYDAPPRHLLEFVRDQPLSPPLDEQWVPPDGIYNRELIEQR